VYKTELTEYNTLPAAHKLPDLLSGFMLLAACLAVLLPCLQFFAHNGFGWQAAGELMAYSSLGRTAAPIPGQEIDAWQVQYLVTEAEAVSLEEPAAATTLPLTAEQLANLQDVIHCLPEAGDMVALTFDDGPSGQFTSRYLDALDQYGVRATFFLLGLQVQRNPGLADMIADRGHELGNHTFGHHNLRLASLAAAMQDITLGERLIEHDSQRKILFFRPPGGNLNPPLIKMTTGMGLKIILWNIDPRDWDPASSKEHIVNNVLSNLQPGSIVVMHEGHQRTLDALPDLIEGIRQRGYRIVTISELLAAASANESQQAAALDDEEDEEDEDDEEEDEYYYEEEDDEEVFTEPEETEVLDTEAPVYPYPPETETPSYTYHPEEKAPVAGQQPPY
jgi:peptidoglycan/xylan/chitin deacetylase (PgdA/CDA1 family)